MKAPNKSKFFSNQEYLELQVPDSFQNSTILDFPWKMAREELRLIGSWRKMIGDDDTLLLLFVSSEGKVCPVNTNYLSNFGEMKSYLYREWGVDCPEKYIRPTVLYPEELYGMELYKSHLRVDLQRAFGNTHPGEGELSEEVVAYLEVVNL